MWCVTVLLTLCHSLFLSLLLRVPHCVSTVTNVFYVYICVWSCLILCICFSLGSIFHIREKTCGFVFLNLTYFT
jgi:hypothetical protein